MIKERIIQFLSTEGLSPSQFAEKLGIQRSSISHILSGRNKPSYDFFSRLISKYPTISLEWFFNGKGPIFKDTASDLFSEEVVLNEELNTPIKNTDVNPTNEITNVKSINKIVMLFTDGTFEVFSNQL